jgi:D-aminopeptidase
VAQGAVGAGRGMSCFGFKGGIGSSSRRATLADRRAFMVGALVLANFGVAGGLLAGGRRIARHAAVTGEAEKGSIIMVLATDAPLDSRQLRRLSLRAGAGLARTGSFFGHGSGDIALAFSTGYTIPHDPAVSMPALAMVHEALLDPLFQAAAEATEQAILNALWHADTVAGRDGHVRRCLRDWLDKVPGA